MRRPCGGKGIPVARGGFTASPGEILVLIRSGRVQTRRDLQRLTGLSRSTVSSRLNQRTSSGYIRAVEQRLGATGRPAELLSFEETDKLVLAADLGATHARFALTDAGGDLLAERTEELIVQQPPAVVLKIVIRRFRDLLRDVGRDRARLTGVGVGLSGPVDFQTGSPVQPPIMPGWHGYPVARKLSEAFGCPAFVDNDANLLGLGEARARYPDVDNLLFVKVGTGIGAGIILGGQPQRGRPAKAATSAISGSPGWSKARGARVAPRVAWRRTPAAPRWPACSPRAVSTPAAVAMSCALSARAIRRRSGWCRTPVGCWARCWRPRSPRSIRRSW